MFLKIKYIINNQILAYKLRRFKSLEFDFHKKKTYTQHWNNFRTKPRKRSSFSVFFKKFKNSFYNFLGFKLSVRLIKNQSQKDEAYSSFVVDLKVKKYRNNLILEQIIVFLKSSGLKFCSGCLLALL